MKKLLKKDITTWQAVLLGAVLVLVKLVLTGRQLVLATPDFALLDDTLMYEAARSITQGDWLGEYNWLTLGKYAFFPVWLAGLHTLHIPYLLGGQLLQLAAALAGAWALAPAVRKNWARLVCFAALFYNPAASAAFVQLRIYRDNITPALSLLLFAGFVGYALRWRRPLRESWCFLLIGGAGLAGSYLNREDGVWLLPFAVLAAAVTVWFVLCGKNVCGRWAKALGTLAPFAVLACGVLVFCAMNAKFYGRFVLSDFTSREFKDAYGALTRVTQQQERDKVPVPHETRMRIYAAVPEFAALQPYLETEMMYNNYGSIPEEEFGAGGFYWALREAADDAGIYTDAKTAQAYFASLADAVNAACDSGLLESGPRRSGTMPPVKAKYILPTLQEGAVNFGRLLTFAQARPYYKDTLSTQLNGQPERRAEYETFLGSGVNWVAQAGTDKPYYSPLQKLCYLALETVWLCFMVLVPAAFVLALVRQIRGGGVIGECIRRKELNDELLVWIVQLGLLLCAVLRCCIVAFMAVAAFNDVEDIMYLSSAHPILLLYCLIGVFGMEAKRGPKTRG